MFPLKKIKKEFNLNGFVILRQVFSKKEIGKILNEIEKIILKSIRIKNTHLHYTDDKKVNTIHNINRYIKKSSIINFSKKKSEGTKTLLRPSSKNFFAIARFILAPFFNNFFSLRELIKSSLNLMGRLKSSGLNFVFHFFLFWSNVNVLRS